MTPNIKSNLTLNLTPQDKLREAVELERLELAAPSTRRDPICDPVPPSIRFTVSHQTKGGISINC
jgi:hypothetical protein